MANLLKGKRFFILTKLKIVIIELLKKQYSIPNISVILKMSYYTARDHVRVLKAIGVIKRDDDKWIVNDELVILNNTIELSNNKE